MLDECYFFIFGKEKHPKTMGRPRKYAKKMTFRADWNPSYPFGYNFKHEYGAASSISLPGTSEIEHIHGAYVNYNQRGKGLGDLYHLQRLEYFTDSDKTQLLTCVVNMRNEPQVKILRKYGWKFLHEFKSYDGETLCLCCRDVPQNSYSADQQGDTEDDI
jgi:ribosomal protein S18 acetylase RimI-like enzyme